MLDDSELFDAAMNRPRAEREAVVYAACGGDERRAERILELVRLATLADRPERSDSRLDKGDAYGRYRIVALIGEGSFGQVYDALDLELERRVALKLLHPDRAAEVDERRFQREAKILARIDHPNVVRVHDAGVEDGQRFLSMELVVGRSLRAWMRENQEAGWARVVGRLLPAARGLAAAHAVGIVHRDFKPENVLIDDEKGRVVVVDFGIARSHELASTASANERSASSTRAGFQTHSVSGTPGYMAPEQWFGEASPLSDQFAFCRTVIEALGAHLETTPLSTTSETAETRPSPAAVALERPAPRSLRLVLEKGLASNPRDRHHDMDALVHALEKVLNRRRRVRIGLGVAVLTLPALAAITAAGEDPCKHWDANAAGAQLEADWAKIGSAELSRAGDAVRKQFRQELDEDLQDWASGRTTSCLQHASEMVDAATARARDDCFHRWHQRTSRRVRWAAEHPAAFESPRFSEVLPERPDACSYVSSADGLPPLDDQVRASLEAGIDEAEQLWVVGDYARGESVAKRTLAAARRGGHERFEADALLRLGTLAARGGETDRASEFLFEGLELAHRQARVSLVFAFELRLLETILVGQGDARSATALLRLARAQLARMGDRPLLSAELTLMEGHLAQRMGRFEDARRSYREAAERFDELDAGAIGSAAARENLAEVLSVDGLHDEALDLVDRAFDDRADALGEHHPLLIGSRLRAGFVHLRAAQASTNPARIAACSAAALEYAASALDGARAVYGAPSVPVTRGLTLRASVELLGSASDVSTDDATKLLTAVEALDSDDLSHTHRVEALQVARDIFHTARQWEDALRASLELAHVRRSTRPEAGPDARNDDLYLISHVALAGNLEEARTRLAKHQALYDAGSSTDSKYAADLQRLQQGLQPATHP